MAAEVDSDMSIATRNTIKKRMRRHSQLEPSESIEFVESRDDRSPTACIEGKLFTKRANVELLIVICMANAPFADAVDT